jgi:hypothetical protein
LVLPLSVYVENHVCWSRGVHVIGATIRTKTLMASMELGRTLSRKVNPDAFLFKATKGR